MRDGESVDSGDEVMEASRRRARYAVEWLREALTAKLCVVGHYSEISVTVRIQDGQIRNPVETNDRVLYK